MSKEYPDILLEGIVTVDDKSTRWGRENIKGGRVAIVTSDPGNEMKRPGQKEKYAVVEKVLDTRTGELFITDTHKK